MPFNGMKEVSFNVLIVRHLLIIKINLENILVHHNFYCTISTFMNNWHTAWCIFTESSKFASKISLKDLTSIEESHLACSNCAACYAEVNQKACREGHGSVTFMCDHVTITCTASFKFFYVRMYVRMCVCVCVCVYVRTYVRMYASFNMYYCTCGQSRNSALCLFIHGYMVPEKQRVVHHGTWSWLWCHFSCDIYHYVQKCPWHHVYMII